MQATSTVSDVHGVPFDTFYASTAGCAYGLACRLLRGDLERCDAIVTASFLEIWRVGPETDSQNLRSLQLQLLRDVRQRCLALLRDEASSRLNPTPLPAGSRDAAL